MAKKNDEQVEPAISSIPIPPSDSALVIDLPDGQKLLVGKIETGTVIEVATWRGTGRPDSRTNRLMLGMSNEADAKKQEAEAAERKAAAVNGSIKKPFPKNIPDLASSLIFKIRPLVLKLILSSKNLISSLKNKFGKKSSKVVNEVFTESNSKADTKWDDDFELDFQRILDEVSERRVNQKAPNSVKKVGDSASKSKAVRGKSSPGNKSKKRK